MNALKAIPGNYGWPVVGNTFPAFRDPIAFRRRMRARYGDVFRNSFLFRKAVILLGEDANREVLTNRKGDFSNDGGWGRFIGRLFPRGLMLLDGEEHRLHRQAMNPDFSRARLLSCAPLVREASAGAIASVRGGRIDVYPFAKDLSLKIALKAFFGIGEEFDRRSELIDDLSKMVGASLSLVRVPLPLTRFAAALQARTTMSRFLTDYSAHLVGSASAASLFGRLAHEAQSNAPTISRDDVVNHMLFLIMASHDTTASAITSTLYSLTRHAEWQELVSEEARAASGEEGSQPLLDAVVKEALRLYPPVPELPRTAVRDVELLGYTIPAGTRIGISPAFTHRMPEYWEEPDRFDPGRFLSGRFDAGKYKYRYIPFGGGAHHCIGFFFGLLETKLVVTDMLRRHRLSSRSNGKDQFAMFPFPRPRQPFIVELAGRA